MNGCTASKCSVSARDREVFRYYLPSSSSIPDKDAGPSKKASSDPTLTAFAQLGCLRINCKRGIITLSTKDTEYVLAEATQELSLQKDDDETDNLWHGEGALLPGRQGLGAEIRKVFDGPDPPAIFLCGDLAADDRFKDAYPVVNPPHLRAFACVPLISPLHNIHVGNYIVVDDKPRDNLSDGERQFLADMALTVMDYLEAGRVKKQQYRAERMIKAIGLFIEGKSTLREWWLETGHKYQHASLKKRARDSTPLDRQADIEFGVQETTDYFSRNGLNGLADRSYRSALSKSPSSVSLSTTDQGERMNIGDGRPPMPRNDTVLSGSDLTPTSVPHSTDGSSQATRRDTLASTADTTPSTLVSKSYQDRNSSVTTFDDTVTDPTPDPEKHNSVQFDLPPPEPTTHDESKDLQNAVLSSDVKGVFARASNLIREAIGVEGVIYYDASVGSFGGSSNKEVMNEKAPGAFSSDQLIDNMVTTSEDDYGRQSSGTDAEYKLVEDITYLAAFGNSTMAEIARLSAQVLSKMKTDFISSISHELRSPLHGVLASVEFLQETQMTEIQSDMVSNIHASGKVLLDTINHVLDFSKVNRKTKNKKRMPKRKLKKLGRRESVDEGGEEKADICILSEEVIESIYAGQGVSKKALGLAGHRRHPSVGSSESPITVIVDIQWRPNWTFEIDAGAWRRIIMNLFSNAMKYTKAGFVNIAIEVEEDVASHSKKSRANIVLKIKDSGKGISQEFLKHQLYKPFTQEDSLATGAGLGLSIVKAIIQDLGGRIEFQSEPGCGTEATPDSLKVVNECFDRYPDITETPTGILSAEFEAAMMLKSTVQDTLVDWFGMEDASATTSEPSVADVVVVMESGMGEKSLDEILQAHYDTYPKKEEKSVAIVLTSSILHDVERRAFRISHHITRRKRAGNTHRRPSSRFPHQSTNIRNVKEHPAVESNSPIQVKSSEQENAKPPLTNGDTPDSEKALRVLLVEDNEINLKLLIATMRKLNLDHATAVNGLEAFNSYKDCEGNFDVIFMDISMPVMSGIESTRHIRRFEKENGLQPVALIALTGAANPSTRQEAFSSGVDLFLTKPVPMKALRGMLDDLRREGRGVFAGM
ncbi:putative sensor protein gacS [Cadophora sp. MPI-SDFR-AT-0126]|nr:putative sensor protein gacS [Leotiomycetes sp. MPI-SDFR-AT-0126]